MPKQQVASFNPWMQCSRPKGECNDSSKIKILQGSNEMNKCWWSDHVNKVTPLATEFIGEAPEGGGSSVFKENNLSTGTPATDSGQSLGLQKRCASC